MNSAAWDQVLSFGEYQHVTVDDQPVVTVFDASKCRFMLDDFGARKNDIFVDRRHEVADDTTGTGDELLAQVDEWGQTDGRAMAWADALCMVVAGVVVKYVRHQSAPENPPTLNELRRPDGAYPDDGVYARRYTVTPLGADPKEGLSSFRYTSPYFVPMRDGWRLLNYTATNDPRMEGVALGAIEMHRQADGSWSMQSCGLARIGRQVMQRVAKRAAVTMENSMPEMTPESKAAIMKAAGCMEGDTPEMKHDKLMAYARRMEEESCKAEEARKKMEAESSEMKRKMEEESRHKMEEEERRMGRKMTDEERAKFEAGGEGEHKEPDGDEKAAMQAMSRKIAARDEKISMLEGELAQIKKTVGPLAATAEATKKREARESAAAAISMGRIPADHKGDEDKTIAWLASKFEEGEQVAEEFLFPEGKFRPSERAVMQRLTAKGAGKGAPQPDQGNDTPGARYSQAMTRAYKKLDEKKQPRSSDAADKLVERDEPEIWAAHWNGGR